MKKKFLLFLIIIFVLTAMCLLNACGEQPAENNPSNSGESTTPSETTDVIYYSITMNNGVKTETQLYLKDTVLNFTAETIRDKEFICWLVNGVYYSINKEINYTVTDDVIITAIYSNFSTIDTIDVNGGLDLVNPSIINTYKDAVSVKLENKIYYNCSYKLPVPVKPHYTFIGWYSLDGSTKYTDDLGQSLENWEGQVTGFIAQYEENPFIYIDIDTESELEKIYIEELPYTYTAQEIPDKECIGWLNSSDEDLYENETNQLEINKESLGVSNYSDIQQGATFVFKAKYKESYKMVVIGGDGSGNYSSTDDIDITYNGQTGYDFLKWSVKDQFLGIYDNDKLCLVDSNEQKFRYVNSDGTLSDEMDYASNLVDYRPELSFNLKDLEKLVSSLSGGLVFKVVTNISEYNITYRVDSANVDEIITRLTNLGFTDSDSDGIYELVENKTYKSTILLQTVANTQHYRFGGWQVTTGDAIPSRMPAKDIILTSSFTPEKLYVSIAVHSEDSDKGVAYLNSTKQVTGYFDYNSTIKFKVTAYQGYEFSTWEDSNGDKVTDAWVTDGENSAVTGTQIAYEFNYLVTSQTDLYLSFDYREYLIRYTTYIIYDNEDHTDDTTMFDNYALYESVREDTYKYKTSISNRPIETAADIGLKYSSQWIIPTRWDDVRPQNVNRYNDGSFIMPSNDVEFVAIYRIKTYDISFAGNPNVESYTVTTINSNDSADYITPNKPNNYTVPFGAEVGITINIQKGYRFTNLKLNNTTIDTDGTTGYTCNLTFKMLNGGVAVYSFALDHSMYSIEYYLYYDRENLDPNISLSSYITTNSGSTIDINGHTYSEIQDISNIVLDTGGNYGDEIDLPAIKQSVENLKYDFIQWQGLVKYTDDDEWEELDDCTSMPDGNVRMYATLRLKTYSISIETMDNKFIYDLEPSNALVKDLSIEEDGSPVTYDSSNTYGYYSTITLSAVNHTGFYFDNYIINNLGIKPKLGYRKSSSVSTPFYSFVENIEDVYAYNDDRIFMYIGETDSTYTQFDFYKYNPKNNTIDHIVPTQINSIYSISNMPTDGYYITTAITTANGITYQDNANGTFTFYLTDNFTIAGEYADQTFYVKVEQPNNAINWYDLTAINSQNPIQVQIQRLSDSYVKYYYISYKGELSLNLKQRTLENYNKAQVKGLYVDSISLYDLQSNSIDKSINNNIPLDNSYNYVETEYEANDIEKNIVIRLTTSEVRFNVKYYYYSIPFEKLNTADSIDFVKQQVDNSAISGLANDIKYNNSTTLLSEKALKTYLQGLGDGYAYDTNMFMYCGWSGKEIDCNTLEEINITDGIYTHTDGWADAEFYTYFIKLYSFDGSTINFNNNILTNYRSYFEANYTSIEIPGTTSYEKAVNGTPITTISANMFKDFTQLTEITMPESLTTIGNSAFMGCTSLNKINRDSITTIGDSAFENCTSLDTINWATLETIGMQAFSNTGFTAVTIGSNVKSIGSMAFSGILDLENVYYNGQDGITIPNNANVFKNSGDSGIGITLHIGATATNISSSLFGNAGEYVTNGNHLKEVVFDSSSTIVAINDNAFRGTSIEYFEFSSRIANIGTSTFVNCMYLTTVDMSQLTLDASDLGATLFSGSGVKEVIYLNSNTINGSLFAGATDLITLYYSTAITNIGGNAFSGCTALLRITDITNKTEVESDEASHKLLDLSSIISIGNNAFYNCTSLEQIDVGTVNSLAMGTQAFGSCTNLKVINYNAKETTGTITNKQYAPFKADSFSNIITLNIGSNVETISDYLFDGLRITSLTIPSNVTSIGMFAFGDIISLTELNYRSNATITPNENGGPFARDCTSLNTNSVTLNIYDNVTKLAAYLFYGIGVINQFNLLSTTAGFEIEEKALGAIQITNMTFSTMPSIVIDDDAFLSAQIGTLEFTSNVNTITINDSALSVATIISNLKILGETISGINIMCGEAGGEIVVNQSSKTIAVNSGTYSTRNANNVLSYSNTLELNGDSRLNINNNTIIKGSISVANTATIAVGTNVDFIAYADSESELINKNGLAKFTQLLVDDTITLTDDLTIINDVFVKTTANGVLRTGASELDLGTSHIYILNAFSLVVNTNGTLRVTNLDGTEAGSIKIEDGSTVLYNGNYVFDAALTSAWGLASGTAEICYVGQALTLKTHNPSNISVNTDSYELSSAFVLDVFGTITFGANARFRFANNRTTFETGSTVDALFNSTNVTYNYYFGGYDIAATTISDLFSDANLDESLLLTTLTLVKNWAISSTVEIESPITFNGNNKTITATSGTAIDVDNIDVTIQNVTITTSNANNTIGITGTSANKVITLNNVTITGFAKGIDVTSISAIISNSNISSVIGIEYGKTVNISATTIRAQSYGIYSTVDSSQLTISNNVGIEAITSSTLNYGVYIDADSAGVSIFDVVITAIYSGIYIEGATANVSIVANDANDSIIVNSSEGRNYNNRYGSIVFVPTGGTAFTCTIGGTINNTSNTIKDELLVDYRNYLGTSKVNVAGVTSYIITTIKNSVLFNASSTLFNDCGIIETDGNGYFGVFGKKDSNDKTWLSIATISVYSELNALQSYFDRFYIYGYKQITSNTILDYGTLTIPTTIKAMIYGDSILQIKGIFSATVLGSICEKDIYIVNSTINPIAGINDAPYQFVNSSIALSSTSTPIYSSQINWTFDTVTWNITDSAFYIDAGEFILESNSTINLNGAGYIDVLTDAGLNAKGTIDGSTRSAVVPAITVHSGGSMQIDLAGNNTMVFDKLSNMGQITVISESTLSGDIETDGKFINYAPFTLTTGDFIVNNGELTIRDEFEISAGDFIIDMHSVELIVNAQEGSFSITYNELQLNGGTGDEILIGMISITGDASFNGDIVVDGHDKTTITVNGNLTLTTGDFTVTTGAFICNGDITISSGDMTVQSTAEYVFMQGDLTVSGTVTANGKNKLCMFRGTTMTCSVLVEEYNDTTNEEYSLRIGEANTEDGVPEAEVYVNGVQYIVGSGQLFYDPPPEFDN